MNVVSLVPSVTETLSAWGITPIACTKYCERPDLHHVGGTKNPQVEAIVALAPDLVVVDAQENRLEDYTAFTDADLNVLALDVVSLESLNVDLQRLAKAVGHEHPVDEVPQVLPLNQRAFVPIWRRPWMSIGADTFGSRLLEAIGITNICSESESNYPELDLSTVAELQPNLIIVPSEPYEFDDAHLEEFANIAPAVRVDGRDLFWWGARTPEAIQRLHDALHPFA
ncbi:MAG: cobalamin-binding protein [Acidimicrobiaceae bacterium]|nr:cobalamin-binding protein [Acidimicrobiaceae bacterium]HBU75900.1 cobalamin-binding protein [Acidimicrobiaceae bacterium]